MRVSGVPSMGNALVFSTGPTTFPTIWAWTLHLKSVDIMQIQYNKEMHWYFWTELWYWSVGESVVHCTIEKQTANVYCGLVYLLCLLLFILNKVLLHKVCPFLCSRVLIPGNKDLMVFKKANVNTFIERPQVESILQDITWPQRWAQRIFIYMKQLWMIIVKQILVQIECSFTNIQCKFITLHLQYFNCCCKDAKY